MTVSALAKELGVSTPTIYRRLKDNGIDIGDLRDGKELSQYGVQQISSLFDGSKGVTDGATDTEHVTLREVKQDEVVEMAMKIASLTAQVTGLQALVAQIEGERDELRRQLATVTAALEREQTDRQQERLLLTSGPADGRGHWWQRLFGGQR